MSRTEGNFLVNNYSFIPVRLLMMMMMMMMMMIPSSIHSVLSSVLQLWNNYGTGTVILILLP